MGAATEESAPDSSELNRLLTDIRETTVEPHALQQHAVLAFGRRASAQPPLHILLQDAVTLVGEVLHTEFGGVGELRGDTLVLAVHALGERNAFAAPHEHCCAVSDVA